MRDGLLDRVCRRRRSQTVRRTQRRSRNSQSPEAAVPAQRTSPCASLSFAINGINRAAAIDGQTDTGEEIVFDKVENRHRHVFGTALTFDERGADGLFAFRRW